MTQQTAAAPSSTTPTDVAATLPRDEFDQRSTVAVALAPVRCIDCDTYVPAGWIDYTDSPKCVATGRTHRVERYVLTHVVDLAWNTMQQACWTGTEQQH